MVRSHFTHALRCAMLDVAAYQITSSMAAVFGRYGMPPPACNRNLRPFDLETGTRVASKVGSLTSKFGHAKPLGFRIIRYVRYRRTDRQTDGQKQRLLPPSLRRRRHRVVVEDRSVAPV